MDLETALQVIKSLEQQLDELEDAEKEYENEMEEVIENLKKEVVQKNQELSSNKKQIVDLEIRVDELETQNAVLLNRNENLQAENDQHLEKNVLLEHELAYMKETLSTSSPSTTIEHKKIRRPDVDDFKVTTSGSTLFISPLQDRSKQIQHPQVSISKVISLSLIHI